MRNFDVIVVGGGHAGVEAAAAATRMGGTVALISFERGNIGAMSCNPAIGGLGKGHLVREVDACDGLLARAADRAAIHHRMLNRSKGTAVQGPRVQADRRRFRSAVQSEIASMRGLSLVEGEVAELAFSGCKLAGVKLADGTAISGRTVILATGTFLGGRLFCGDEVQPGGRTGERSASRLAIQIKDRLPLARLKTGTPPRLDGRTIDWSKLARQASDIEPWTMSPMTGHRLLPQLSCYIARTNSFTHEIIAAAFDRSPLYSGAIAGQGPRYCPSIEDKVRRFGDRDGHQIFLEPEGLDDHLIYPNGISTSLPADVQKQFLRSIKGLEAVKVVQPGYAVEYDHVDPRALDHGLQVMDVPGLFCAGQINGTTGYEEAAAQGLVAGTAAACVARHAPPPQWERSDSYIGVMIDDLTLQGVTEPYRMLTARAEFRLRLRADNAASRLGAFADRLGLLGSERRDHWHQRQDGLATARRRIESNQGPATWSGLIRQERVGPEELADHPDFMDLAPEIVAEAYEDCRYAPYVERQQREAEKVEEANVTIPDNLDFHGIAGLSLEMRERLSLSRPRRLTEARRIRGITPAALAAILVHCRAHVG